MDKLSVMRAFCRIVELKSFSKAAKDLGLSPAILSRETKLLEESLGCVLLTRTTRSMTLTEHGAHYYEEARRLLSEVEALETGIQARAQQLKGTLRVNAPLSFGIAVLAPITARFRELYPDLHLGITLDDRVVDMVEGGFDISIRVLRELPDSSLIARRIGRSDQALFAAPKYLSERGRPTSPEDLSAHSKLGFSLADHEHTWQLEGPADGTTLLVTPEVSVNNSLFIRDMLLANQGIGSLPSFLSAPLEGSGVLERVLPEYSLPSRNIYAVLASRLAADAKARTFIEFLESELSA
ncbi:LysR family transcriptional regulator [Pseudovibrio sp. SPO723]|uniref:LysR family transcriptional regulator n=1 Tax=Nesiotobacter zosterae TaxID=392721 RepID=UPI0029C582CD|nr:LysR family transcriptional regulator [Pseudovibrio sp. SPO723]MDX5594222.1 LysR family transcriptional regulator [Pseudovibrio sp. SPO723]